MSQPIKTASSHIFQQIEENRQFTGYYNKLSIPATPKGNQQFKYTVGQPVTFSDISPIRGTGKVINCLDMFPDVTVEFLTATQQRLSYRVNGRIVKITGNIPDCVKPGFKDNFIKIQD